MNQEKSFTVTVKWSHYSRNIDYRVTGKTRREVKKSIIERLEMYKKIVFGKDITYTIISIKENK